MPAPIPNALVTATPARAGLPTVSGMTDSSGNVPLPLALSTRYTLRFTGSAVGTVPSFQPGNATFVLYKLKNKGTQDVSVAGQRLPAGQTVAAYPQSLAVQPSTPGAGSWKPAGIFKAPTQSKTSLVMPKSDRSVSYGALVTRFYAIDGDPYPSTNRAYDGTTNTWSSRASDPTPRHGLTAATLGGKVYAIDGLSGASGGTRLSTNNAYDPATNTWSARAHDLVTRFDPAAGVVGTGLYVTGASVRELTEYLASANSWKQRTSAPTSTAVAQLGGIGSGLYDFYGRTAYRYDTGTGVWSTRASESLLDTTSGGVAGVMNQRYYVYGGLGAGVHRSTNFSYDPTSNTWHSRTAGLARRLMAAGVSKGSLWYAADGSTVTGLVGINQVYDDRTNTWSSRTGDVIRYWLAGAVA